MLEGLQRKRLLIVIVILLIIEFASIYMMYNSITHREVVLDDVQIREVVNNGSLAIMLQNGNSYVASSTFPTSGYTFNASLSGCIDEQGNLVTNALSYNNSTRKATVSTGYTSYCYLYFDRT